MTESQPPQTPEVKLRERKYSLAELVARMSPDNSHPEEGWGTQQGEEVW